MPQYRESRMRPSLSRKTQTEVLDVLLDKIKAHAVTAGVKRVVAMRYNKKSGNKVTGTLLG